MLKYVCNSCVEVIKDEENAHTFKVFAKKGLYNLDEPWMAGLGASGHLCSSCYSETENNLNITEYVNPAPVA